MSALEREMRSMSLQSTSGNRRSGSKTPKKSSGLKSPRSGVTSDDEDELDTDLNFGKQLDELLNEKLSSGYLNSDSGNEDDKLSDRSLSINSTLNSRSGSRLDSIMLQSSEVDDEDESNGRNRIFTVNDVITTLNLPRTQLNSASREVLFYELYKMIVNKPMSNSMVVNESDLLQLISFIRTSRSHIEFITSLKACVAYSLIDVDEVASTVIEKLFPLLLEKIVDPNNEDDTEDQEKLNKQVMVKSTCIISYVNLLLVIMDGSGCSGVEEFADLLIELAEGYLPASNNATYHEELVINSLSGVGIVVTLIYKNRHNTQSLDNFIQDNLPRFLAFLEPEITANIQKAAARLIALCYELFDYQDEEVGNYADDEDDDDDDEFVPYYDISEVTSAISSLIRQSSKKVSKKDKKESRSVMREALNTVENYSTRELRTQYKKQITRQKNEDGESTVVVLSRIKLSKTRTFAVTSWFTYFRIMVLKWAYGPGFQIHLFNSRSIDLKELIVKPERYITGSYGKFIPDDLQFGNDGDYNDDLSGVSKKISGKAKTIKINAARTTKARQELGETDE